MPRTPLSLPQIDLDAAKIKPNNQSPPGPIGNTTGIILPQTAPNPKMESAPPIKPKEEEKSWWKRWGSDAVHLGLDVVGLIPGVGEIADGANALIYLAEGDKVNAAISAAAMIPGAGMAATGAKLGKKAVGAVAEGAAKKAAREAEEALAKKAAKEAEEKAAKEAAEKEAKATKGGKDKGNCKHLEKGPPGATHKGGKHGKVKEDSVRGIRESHHIPPDSISPHGREAGPAISMDYADHRALSSTGRSSAHPTSIAQKSLANSGQIGFLAAMMTEITEIRQKYGNKYDPAIAWMMLWAACMGYIPSPGGKK